MEPPANVKTSQPSTSAMSLDPEEIQKQDLKKVEEEQVLRLRGGNLGYSNPPFSSDDVLDVLAMSAAVVATGTTPGFVAVKSLPVQSLFSE